MLCIYEDLNERSNYTEIWQDICLEIQDYLHKHETELKVTKESLDGLYGLIDNIINNNLVWIKFSRDIKKVFGNLAELNIKTVLILDEFDNASLIFNEGTKHFELFRSIFSDAKFNVSAITLSRRNLYTIEGATYQSSTFHNVLDIVPLKGFDDSDMDEYFNIFSKEGIVLEEKQKARIVYYAGNLPYLLSIMGHYIIEAAESGLPINIDEIFYEKCKAINDYYRDCIKHLERDDDLKRIIPFVIGPNVGVTKSDKDELYNLGYFSEKDGKLIAISEYFSLFLSTEKLQIHLWDNIITLEKKLKLLLESQINLVAKHYGVNEASINLKMLKILEKIEGITDNDIKRYQAFIQSNLRDFNIESTYIDVMSLSDVVKIIKDCWADVFSKFFNFDSYSKWENRLNKCAMARNPVAHGHEEYLSELDKKEVDTYCKQIFDVLGETLKEKTKEAESKKTVQIGKPSNDGIDYSLLGKELTMVVSEALPSGEVKGIISNNYPATILKSYMKNVDPQQLIGQEIRVVVKSINNKIYIVQPVKN